MERDEIWHRYEKKVRKSIEYEFYINEALSKDDIELIERIQSSPVSYADFASNILRIRNELMILLSEVNEDAVADMIDDLLLGVLEAVGIDNDFCICEKNPNAKLTASKSGKPYPNVVSCFQNAKESCQSRKG